MASLLHPSLLLSKPSPFSPPSPHRSFIYPATRELHLPGITPSHKHGKLLICGATLEEPPVFEPPPPPLPPAELVASLKLNLLSAVSGLNRGLAASEEDLKRADFAAKELEAVGGPVDLYKDLDKLQGRWKLIYSSAFSSRTLGGSRPGPPTGRLLPITLGQVFQRIDIFSKDFDNIVELQLGAPWPLPPLDITATLAHKFEITGTASVKIIFEKTTVKTTGNLSQLPPFEIPRIPDALRPPSNTGTGDFEVTYLDSDTRVTRGDRGELRVFVIS
ncbi:Plastid lipid-associated protein/fibrillin conserved domain-containing protein [Dioscorea alata]|uniref:Plastid lipid-associated protein/fibrillin conserved domain-containing protein n=1 Tax=Dioscorea alata TaxID=55571 RepID=A0ACB7WRZ2_DIOAL|nr:Plastid lipid-associated protein/fibrillin conserved domain-containing protein [Dioscorea alata]